MKYFTLELYVAFNSEDENIADEAYQTWEENIIKYQKYLMNLKLEGDLKDLSNLNLHDEKIEISDLSGGKGDFVELNFPGLGKTFIFELSDKIVENAKRLNDEVFDRLKAIHKDVIEREVLYNEIACIENGGYNFSILLDNLKEIVIPFSKVQATLYTG